MPTLFRLLFIYRLALVLAVHVGSVFAVRSIQAEDVRTALRRWEHVLQSEALRNVRLRIEIDAISKGYKSSTRMEIIRRGDWWRASSVGQNLTDGKTIVTEDIYTDQRLRLHAVGSSAQGDELRVKGTGELKRVRDESFMPGTVFGVGGEILFGFWQRNPRVTIPGALLEASNLQIIETDKGAIAEAHTPAGYLRVEFRGAETLSPASVLSSDPKSDEGHGQEIKIEDIQWDNTSRPAFPVAFTRLLPNEWTKGDEQLPMHIRVLDYELNAKISDDDFLPTSEFPEGSPVHVSDVPVECEWRNGRIVPLAGSPPLQIVELVGERSRLRLYLIIANVIVLLVLSIFFYRKWQKSTSP